jgi:hypothetical protein
MLTRREANQRAELYGVRLAWQTDMQEFRVTLHKWTQRQAERMAYFTSDLEDALHTGISMSRRNAA